jgi:hypothetical protein
VCEWQILCEIVISNRNSIRTRHFVNGSSPITLGVALYVVDALRTTVVRTRRCNLAGYLSRLAWMRSQLSSGIGGRPGRDFKRQNSSNPPGANGSWSRDAPPPKRLANQTIAIAKQAQSVWPDPFAVASNHVQCRELAVAAERGSRPGLSGSIETRARTSEETRQSTERGLLSASASFNHVTLRIHGSTPRVIDLTGTRPE